MFESNNLPIHSEQMISYPYGVQDSSYSCGFHTGVDLIPHGLTESNPLLYSVVNRAEVVYIHTNPNNALGYYVLIYDGTHFFRYCHLQENSIQVNVGDVIDKTMPIARMGDSGTHVTGTHLHLECSTSATWSCNTFENPCDILGFPNIDDFVMNWIPDNPIKIKKHKFNWVLFNQEKRRRLQ